MSWYKYLDPRFAKRQENVRTRDKVVAICSDCQACSTLFLCNLKKQLKKYSRHLCKECGYKEGVKNQKIKKGTF
jgi:uncharacterized C2H2 Zn-finger protein